MKTWFLYLLWLLTGGKEGLSAANDTDTGSTASSVEDHYFCDDIAHDDIDDDVAECDTFGFEDSEFEDFEDDEELFH